MLRKYFLYQDNKCVLDIPYRQQEATPENTVAVLYRLRTFAMRKEEHFAYEKLNSKVRKVFRKLPYQLMVFHF